MKATSSQGFLVTQSTVMRMQVLRQLANGVEPAVYGLEESVGVLATAKYRRLQPRLWS